MKISRTTSRGCGLLLLMLISCGLIGCATGPSAWKGSPLPAASIYQPRVLVLPADRPVQTISGVYTPYNVEVWHSQAAFREMELQVEDLTGALAQERARSR